MKSRELLLKAGIEKEGSFIGEDYEKDGDPQLESPQVDVISHKKETDDDDREKWWERRGKNWS